MRWKHSASETSAVTAEAVEEQVVPRIESVVVYSVKVEVCSEALAEEKVVVPEREKDSLPRFMSKLTWVQLTPLSMMMRKMEESPQVSRKSRL